MNWIDSTKRPFPLPPVGKPVIIYGKGEFMPAIYNGRGFSYPKSHDGYMHVPSSPFTHFCQDVPEGSMMEMWEKVKDQLTAQEEPDLWSITNYPHLFKSNPAQATT